VIEGLSGEDVQNGNPTAHIARGKFYVCPVCGNVIRTIGEAVVSCCGIVLPPLEAEPADDAHRLNIERGEDEYDVTIAHEMSKAHYISFMMAARDNACEIVKLYPEGSAEARFKVSRTKWLYYYCNRHGLFQAPVRKKNEKDA
jgi:desulfoferrodoxin (superoxide reductase-like protein)